MKNAWVLADATTAYHRRNAEVIMLDFHKLLRRLRKRYIGKQLGLAASLGCTEAAISFWESGRRLPLRPALPAMLECFRIGGASPSEVETLQRAYDSRKGTSRRRRGGARNRSIDLQLNKGDSHCG